MAISKRHKRAAFLAGSAGAFAGVTSLVSHGQAAEFEYKLGSALTIDNPAIVAATQTFNAVRNETNGRFVAHVFANGTLGNEQSLISQVRVGAIQFFMIGTSISTFVPIVNIVGIPFAFASVSQALKACDADLGALVRQEIQAKGLYTFPTMYDFGMRHMTTSAHPIRVPEDMSGLKIRTAATKIYEDFMHAFGASPTPIASGETYTALQTHLVDGEEAPLGLIDGFRFAEVQKFLSLTNHGWTNLYLFANMQALTALPADIRASLERNARKYALAEWRASANINASLADKLRRLGMTINTVDTEPFRRRLAPLYTKWKADFGPAAWDTLEKYTGKLA